MLASQTQKRVTMHSSFQKLDEIVHRINVHPVTVALAKAAYDDMETPIPCLSDTDLMALQPQDYQALVEELVSELSGLFINNQGQNSRAYYEAKKAGYKLAVGESDSFGPLSSRFSNKNRDWVIYYG